LTKPLTSPSSLSNNFLQKVLVIKLADKSQNKKQPKDKKQAIIGLKVRLLAAERLQSVLGGSNFIPFSESDISDGRDRALANKLVTSALRYHGHLNYIFKKTLKKGMPAKSANFEASMRIGLAELLFLDEMAEHSSIFLAVEAIKQNKKTAHLGKLANGILRNVQREKQVYKNLPMSELFPDWLQTRWANIYGKNALNNFGKALIKGAELDLTLKEIDTDLIKSLNAKITIFDSVRVKKRDCPVNQLAGFSKGQWWVQDVASAIPARLMGLKSGARILDMCAAPGGKTAQLLKQNYDVVAIDIDENRIKRLEQNLSRLNYTAKLELKDASNFQVEEKFDGVFLDAPCSSTGTFRRHPEVLWQKRTKQSEGRVLLQQKLIEQAISSLKDGGTLIYATCSLEPIECEKQAKWILKTFPQMITSPITKAQVDENDHFIDKNGWLRTTPDMKIITGENNVDDIEGLDGFFAARFILKV